MSDDDSTAKDDVLQQFSQITGGTAEEAAHFVDAAGGDLSTAINFYFQGGGGGGSTSAGSVAGPSGFGCAGSAAAGTSNGRTRSVDDDDDGEDEVRQPIQPKSGVLVPHSFGESYASVASRRAVTNSVFDHMRDFKAESAAQMARAASGRNPLASRVTARLQKSTTSTSDSSSSAAAADLRNGSSSGGGGDPEDSRRRTLASLFRPPVDLITPGLFETVGLLTGTLLVRETASARNLWLLVNIQNVEEFQSQVLNRDVWSNEAVKDIVKSNFVFWQVYSDSGDGERFSAYYHVRSQPHVSVIDPRTGEQVLTMTVGDAVSCADALTTFLGLYPSPNESAVTAVPATRTIEANGVGNSNSGASTSGTTANQLDNGGGRKRTHADTCDPSASTAGSSNQTGKLARADRGSDDDDEQTAVTSPSASSRCSHHNQQLPQEATGDDVITLLVRHPEGGRRVQLGLPDTTPVHSVLTWLCVRERLCADEGCDFILQFPKRVLNEYERTTTLRDLKLGRKEMLHVDKRT